MTPPLRSVIRWALGFLATLALLPTGSRAQPFISEFMAGNATTLPDDDGAYSDWIELHNPGETPVSLDGWYLTDDLGRRTKWRLPAVVLAPGGHLVVFASNKDRSDPTRPLHTNFALSAGGEYLALVEPDGLTVAHDYAPAFPPQKDDISYGTVLLADGTRAASYLRTPTPGADNGGPAALMLAQTVAFSRPSAPFAGSITVELSGAVGAQKIRYELQRGVHYPALEVTAESPEYTGPIVLDRSVYLRAAVFSADDVFSGATASAHYLRVEADLADFASRLPVVVLDTLGSARLFKDSVDYPSWVYGYNPGDERTPVFAGAPVHRTPSLSTVRGNSSADFPKLGFNLKLRDADGRRRPLPLFQLPSFDRWALVGPWGYDRNYLNNPFVYELSRRLGHWAARTRFVEVFVNFDGDDLDLSDYAGIYVLTDRLDIAPGRLALDELSPSDRTEPAISGGYVFKIDEPEPHEIGWRTDRNLPDDTYSAVILSAPGEDEVTAEQAAWLRQYVQRMENALFRDRDSGWAQRTYLDYLDRASWVDHHLLNVFVSNPDAFVRSAYFQKPRGRRILAGPVWDFDRALGGAWDYRGETARSWSGTIEPDVDFWRSGWWGVLATDPEFRQDWIDRWQSLRRQEFSTRNLHTLVDSLAAAVTPEAAARDAARWPDNRPESGNYADQIAELKSWLHRRAEWIDEQFVAPPRVEENAGTLLVAPAPGTRLVYTRDGSDPRALGGAIAPNALVSDSPVSLPATVNLQARSLRAEPAAFPATPWSSATGGPSSSPLRPGSRIVNLSTRAHVGHGPQALVTGIVVADTDTKRVLARGIGPGLEAFGAAGFVADPQLAIVDAAGVELRRNLGWETSPDAARLASLAPSVGAFPLRPGSPDSAVVADLAAGAYTLDLSTPTGRNGTGLLELYALDTHGRTANLSTRALLDGEESTLVGGIVIDGTAHKRLLIRAVGPTLAALGVAGALSDPELTVYRGTAIVASNRRWRDAPDSSAVALAASRVGAFALGEDSADAALLLSLPPGAYTIEVRSRDASTGVALLEIYDVP
jgi:hypothetical protein